MKKQVLSDAIVTFNDALRWAGPLMAERPDDVITRVLAIEPAVLGVAANLAKRACQRLEREGLSERRAAYIFTEICRASAISIELLKLGNASLFNDLINDPDYEKKENKNE
jgi:hypothetical protein